MSNNRNNYSTVDNYQKKDNKFSTFSQSKKTLFLMLIIFLFVIIPMEIIISQSLRIVNLNYQMEQLEDSLSEIQEENREMKRMITKKRSLDRIEQIAREELNMVEAEQIHRLAVNNEAEEHISSTEAETESWLTNLWNGFRRAAAAPLE